jgi:hypothetical protein
MSGEAGGRAGEESGRGRAVLVWVAVCSSDPAVVIDSGVGVVEPDRFLVDAALVIRGSPVLHPTADAVRATGELPHATCAKSEVVVVPEPPRRPVRTLARDLEFVRDMSD